MKSIKDPLPKKLKGDEMGDFIVTASVFAVEGLVSKDILEIVKLQREHFLLVEDKERTNVEKLSAISKKLGKLIEIHLPQEARPITTHKVLVHFPEAVQHTGILSECNGQWIEDECGSLVEEIRRRGIKVKVEEVLTKTVAREQALLKHRDLISELHSSIEAPKFERNARFWDEGDDGLSFLGKGSYSSLTVVERQGIAAFLGFYSINTHWQVIPLELLEFKRAFNGREYHSTRNASCTSSNSTCVAVEFEGREYFGRITKFLKLNHEDKVYRLVLLNLHYNLNPSIGGISRVHRTTFYSKGSIVLLENLKRRVLFAQKTEADDFISVLEVRGDLCFSETREM